MFRPLDFSWGKVAAALDIDQSDEKELLLSYLTLAAPFSFLTKL